MLERSELQRQLAEFLLKTNSDEFSILVSSAIEDACVEGKNENKDVAVYYHKCISEEIRKMGEDILSDLKTGK